MRALYWPVGGARQALAAQSGVNGIFRKNQTYRLESVTPVRMGV